MLRYYYAKILVCRYSSILPETNLRIFYKINALRWANDKAFSIIGLIPFCDYSSHVTLRRTMETDYLTPYDPRFDYTLL